MASPDQPAQPAEAECGCLSVGFAHDVARIGRHFWRSYMGGRISVGADRAPVITFESSTLRYSNAGLREDLGGVGVRHGWDGA